MTAKINPFYSIKTEKITYKYHKWDKMRTQKVEL